MLLEVVHCVAQLLRIDFNLVKRAVVHEDVGSAIAIEKLHLALLNNRLLHLFAGRIRTVDHCAGANVAKFGAHERPTFPRLHMLEIDDLHKTLRDVEGDAVLEVRGGNGGHERISWARTFIRVVAATPSRRPTNDTRVACWRAQPTLPYDASRTTPPYEANREGCEDPAASRNPEQANRSRTRAAIASTSA